MRSKRDDLLRQRTAALLAYAKAMDEMEKTVRYTEAEQSALAEANQHLNQALELEERYLKALPRVVMSRCPFCRQPLYRTFDPYGLDGPWWRGDASPEEPEPCPHFLLLDGALDLAGRPPRAGPFEVRPGPEVPFVIPPLLAKSGVKAVIARVAMENGYVAYPIAYFGERRLPPQELAATWVRSLYVYETQLGETLWRASDEEPDFELGPWLATGKLWWATEEGAAMRLLEGGDCPYASRPGERRRQVLEGDLRWFDVVLPGT